MSTEPTANVGSTRSKVTVRTLRQRKQENQPIVMVTAYDFSSAALLEQTDVDVILVGDSLGMVMLGYESTVSVTMEEMIHHCKAVARGARTPLLVGDLPFLSYRINGDEALRNAGRLLAEGKMEAVKLEGGRELAPVIERMVGAGIPVVGHLGLTPQSVHALGYRAQARTADAARRLVEDAQILQEAGCVAIVLEAIPAPLATYVSRSLTAPTIGIGAGSGCDGQVLVYHDMLGLFDRLQPRFVKRYASIGDQIRVAVDQYAVEVRARSFPADEHTYAISDAEWQTFLQETEAAAASSEEDDQG